MSAGPLSFWTTRKRLRVCESELQGSSSFLPPVSPQLSHPTAQQQSLKPKHMGLRLGLREVYSMRAKGLVMALTKKLK